MRYYIFLFFFYQVFGSQDVFHAYGLSQFRLASLEEPSSCLWLMTAISESAVLRWAGQWPQPQDTSAKEYLAYDGLQNE